MLNNAQSGFRKYHSTSTTLIDVSDYILSNFNEGKVTAAICVDLKKAFDTVNHPILINKLQKLGLDTIALNWFKSYLDDRSQIVQINSTH